MPPVTGQAPELLAAELVATRERLQEMVLELQSSHERVDLANEELTASNEELQSTNEELKSVNEDLYTLNRELEGKNDELAALNRDYDHLLASTEIGTVFLDSRPARAPLQPHVGDFLGSARARSRPARGRDPLPAGSAGALSRRLAALRLRMARESNAKSMLRRWALGARAHAAFQEGHDEGSGVVLTWTDISKIKHIADARPSNSPRTAPGCRASWMRCPMACTSSTPSTTSSTSIRYWSVSSARSTAANVTTTFTAAARNAHWCKNPEVFAGQSVRWEWTSPKGRTYDLFDMPFHNSDGTVSKLEIFHDITASKDEPAAPGRSGAAGASGALGMDAGEQPTALERRNLSLLWLRSRASSRPASSCLLGTSCPRTARTCRRPCRRRWQQGHDYKVEFRFRSARRQPAHWPRHRPP